jgi:ribonuclease P protein component
MRTTNPVRGERMIVFLAPGTGEASFVAGRPVGGAVQRNRARRILRASWRELAFRGRDRHDIVVVARAGIRGFKTQDLIDEMSDLLHRAEASA